MYFWLCRVFLASFSTCSKQGLLSICERASPCGGFSSCGAGALGLEDFSGCGSPALGHRLCSCGAELEGGRCGASLLLGMGNLPASGIEALSPALADGFLTTKPSVQAQVLQSKTS